MRCIAAFQGKGTRQHRDGFLTGNGTVRLQEPAAAAAEGAHLHRLGHVVAVPGVCGDVVVAGQRCLGLAGEGAVDDRCHLGAGELSLWRDASVADATEQAVVDGCGHGLARPIVRKIDEICWRSAQRTSWAEQDGCRTDGGNRFLWFVHEIPPFMSKNVRGLFAKEWESLSKP